MARDDPTNVLRVLQCATLPAGYWGSPRPERLKILRDTTEDQKLRGQDEGIQILCLSIRRFLSLRRQEGAA